MVRLGLAVGLLSLSLLLYELVLTRVFAVVLFSDLAHLTLSLAMLGVGAGALLQHRRQVVASDPHVALFWLGLLQGGAALVALACAANFPLFGVTGAEESWLYRSSQRFGVLQWGWFALLVPLLALPPLLSGVAMAGVFQHHRRHLGVLYGADLGGAALGGLLALPAVALLRGPDAGWLAAGACALASLLVAPSLRTRAVALSGVLLSAVVAVVCVCGEQGVLPMRATAAWSSGTVLETRWTPLTRLIAYRDTAQELILLDNASLSQVVTQEETLAEMETMANRGLAYRLGVPHGRVAVLAASAGPEVAMALRHGHTAVDAIDIEGEIFELVRERYDTPLNPYRDPRVHTIEADARAAMMRAPSQHYQIIHLLNANLFGAAGRVTHAWSPSLLLTREAIATYLDKIDPDGLISLTSLEHTRWLVLTAAAVLAEQGAAAPYQHMAYVGGGHEVVLLRPRPWTREESSILRKALRDFPSAQLLLDPERPVKNPSRKLNMMPYPFARLSGDTLPPPMPAPPPLTDDHPYADTVERITFALRHQIFPEGLLYRTLLVQAALVLGIGGLYVLVPLLRRSERKELLDQGALMGVVACLGFGYLAIEAGLMSELVLFVGHPAYALVTVVTTMLLTSGVGSLLTGRTADGQVLRRLRQALLIVALLGALLAEVVAPALSASLLGAPLTARIALTALCLAPLGLVMGTCFPYTMRLASSHLIPWAWAINGWTSIVGGLFVVLTARLLGHSWALLIALSAYPLALILTARLRRSPPEAPP